MDVAPLTLTVDHLAQKQRSAISQLRRETAELVPSIGHCQRHRTFGGDAPTQHGRPRFRGQGPGINPQFGRKGRVQPQDFRRRCPGAGPWHIEPLKIAGIAVVKGNDG